MLLLLKMGEDRNNFFGSAGYIEQGVAIPGNFANSENFST